MKRSRVLITGGCGFIGSHLAPFLTKKGFDVVVFDKLSPDSLNKQTIFVKGNILNKKGVSGLFKNFGPFETVYHLAAALPNKTMSDKLLWQTNVNGTKQIASFAVQHKTKSLVFTSSNTVYGIPPQLPTTENTAINPLEIYGKSKAHAEKALCKFKDKINIQMFRCPVVSGVGRLGLQAILFEFISENKKIYVLGGGKNKYQFIDVDDLCNAMYKSSKIKGCDVYTIGADKVCSMEDIYKSVIKYAKSTSSIISLPQKPAMAILAFFNKLNFSPLGIYQYTMLGQSLFSDTSKIKQKLSWYPKKTNTALFIENYQWFVENRQTFKSLGRGNLSDNRSLPKMGILKLLKLIS